MKKITFSLMLLSMVSFAQQQYTDVEITNAEPIPSNGTTITRVDNGRLPVLTTYDMRSEFQTDYDSTCDEGLVVEDFAGLPGGVSTCGPEISAAGDSCFAAGELEEGFVMTGSNGSDVVGITSGTIGNSIDLVGANTFTEFTVITFDVPVFAFGIDIWNNSDPTTNFRIFDEDGNLIEEYMLANTVGSEDFFGFIADEPVSSIEIQEANDGGDLVGNMEFGNCQLLGVNTSLAEVISIFPNPAATIVKIKAPQNITVNNVYLFDVLGKKANVTYTNGTIDVSNLSNGIYLLQVETNEGTLVEKIIKK